MKVFCGKKKRTEAGAGSVWKNGDEFRADRSLKIKNHSPDGFQWGYSGSGPSQLALALLLDCLGREAAQRWYQDFKRQVVVGLPDEWVLTEHEIKEWYGRVRPQEYDPEPEEAEHAAQGADL